MNQQDKLAELKDVLVTARRMAIAEASDSNEFSRGLAAGLTRAIYEIEEMLESGEEE